MSINDDILSRGLKERALLSLYEKKLDTDLTKVMSSHKKRLVNSTLKNGNKSVNALNRALTLETRKTYRKIYKNGISELKALANTSSKFHNSTLKESLGKVYRSKVYTGLKVNDLIINSAGTYSEQIASISLSQQRKIKDVVRKGMIDNLAVNKIAKNVGNAIDLPTSQLKTLSRTAITETSSNVSNATYKLNEDVIDGYQYVATLDSRTSMICSRLDGKVFRLDSETGVRPPQHFNCRSTTVPIVKSYEDIKNTSSSRISKRRLSRLNSNTRASFNGQVPGKTNFEEFLRQQDPSFKLAVLGNKRRVDIFDLGKLKFTQFSTKTGELVSISRLEELLKIATPSPITKIKPIVFKVKPSRVPEKVEPLVVAPVEKLSSYANPVSEFKMLDPAFNNKLTHEEFTSRIRSLNTAANADPRYPITFRFQGGADGAGKLKIQGGRLTNKEAYIIASMQDELSDLADIYNIPKLRGLEIKAHAGYSGSMGDGTLRINREWLNNLARSRGVSDFDFSDWSYKSSSLLKPRSGSQFFSEGTSKIRHTFYHEMGHHVHQMIGLSNKTVGYKGRFIPNVEKRLAVLWEKHGLDQLGNSTYGQTNYKEWFAEQFAAHHMGESTRVHPVFKTLIKEIKDGKYN
jgi:SPP1 gp7 family putative phage head morphogenesis protein